MQDNKYLYINWDDFHQDCKKLAQKLKNTYNIGNIKGLIAISRGGLLPAGIISYELDIRNVEAVTVITYDGESQRNNKEAEIISSLSTNGDGYIIIDDLVDSGNTVNILRDKFPKAIYATIYAKPKGLPTTDIYQKEMPDKWIMFPWD